MVDSPDFVRISDLLSDPAKIKAILERARERNDPPAPRPASLADPGCTHCLGMGFTKRYLTDSPSEWRHELERCSCMDVALSDRRRQAMLRVSTLDKHRGRTFTSLRKLSQAAYQAAHGYAQRPEGWLTFLGGFGTGKSHHAAAVAWALAERGHELLWIEVPELLERVRAAFNPNTGTGHDDLFNRAVDAPLLFLDDFGAERGTAWELDRMRYLMMSRYDRNRPTVITSNVEPDTIDGRIMSRMADHQMVYVAGGDKRVTPEGRPDKGGRTRYHTLDSQPLLCTACDCRKHMPWCERAKEATR